MSDMYKTIKFLCDNRKINITTMCRESGASRGVLSDLNTGRIKILSTPTLSKIAEYFNVSVDYLLGNEQQKDPAHEDEVTFDDFTYAMHNEGKELSENSKNQLLEMAKYLKQLEKKE